MSAVPPRSAGIGDCTNKNRNEMKKIALSILAAMTASAAIASPATAGTPASTNIPEAAYPCVDSLSRATFRIFAPDAHDVKLDICGRKYDMAKAADGNWSVTTDPLVQGFHYYFMLVDGVAVNDPASETFYGCGRKASGIEIPESAE